MQKERHLSSWLGNGVGWFAVYGPVNIHISVVYYNQSFVGLCTHNSVWKCLVRLEESVTTGGLCRPTHLCVAPLNCFPAIIRPFTHVLCTIDFKSVWFIVRADCVLKLSQINDFIRPVNYLLNIARQKKRILCKKALVIRVFLYRVSECTYNQKSDDLEICRV